MVTSAQSLKANDAVLENVADPGLRGRMIDYACGHYNEEAPGMLAAMDKALSYLQFSEADAAANMQRAFKTAEAHMTYSQIRRAGRSNIKNPHTRS